MGDFEMVHAWYLIISLLNKSKHHFHCLYGSFNSFVVAWAKVNLYRNGMTQSLPGMQYVTGKQRVRSLRSHQLRIHVSTKRQNFTRWWLISCILYNCVLRPRISNCMNKEEERLEYKASRCRLCHKQFTSPPQLREHLQGRAHKMRLETLMAEQEEKRAAMT